jgi:hypothetical protein
VVSFVIGKGKRDIVGINQMDQMVNGMRKQNIKEKRIGFVS